MRTLTPLLIAFALLALSSSAFAGATCTEVQPSKGVGPLTLGMNRAALEATGLTIEKGFTDKVLEVGPYEVWLEEDAVVTIGVDSADHSCIKLGSADFELPATSLESLAVGSGGACAPIQYNTGATVLQCDNGVVFLEHMAGKTVRVEKAKALEKETCNAWVEPGTPSGPSKLNAAADLSEKTNVCVQNRVLTVDLVPDDVASLYGKAHISTCEQQDNTGATLLDCNYSGVRLIFAGPTQRLSRVESITLRQ